ncbi:MAG: hypothetical protein ACU0GG_18770 [Paracoccaceae bacterium]
MDKTNTHSGYWSGMSPRLRVKTALGLMYLIASMFVMSQAPLLGIMLLTVPILFTVLVIWIGSEDGVSFGPYARKRDTAFSYTLRHIWQGPCLLRWLCGILILTATVVGLGWISTEDMRAEQAAPSLAERASDAATSVSDTTRETARGWFATAKGWFVGDDPAE